MNTLWKTEVFSAFLEKTNCYINEKLHLYII